MLSFYVNLAYSKMRDDTCCREATAQQGLAFDCTWRSSFGRVLHSRGAALA